MSDQGQEQDKTEEATPFKLREARRRGQVAKSQELNSLFLVALAVGAAYLWAESVISGQLELSHWLIDHAGSFSLEPGVVFALFRTTLDVLASVFWPSAVAVVFVAAAANFVQVGPLLTGHPLKPDPKRLNPVNGFKRLFSRRTVYEFCKTLIKFSLFAGIIYLFLVNQLPMLVGLVQKSPATYVPDLLYLGLQLAGLLLGALFMIAAIDLAYTRWDFRREQRMSRREVKEEVKKREGDPQVRQKRRDLQKESVQKAGSARRTPEADVLLTNPTHIAVGVLYDRTSMDAPHVVAKGSGQLALNMRRLAADRGVPVVEHRRLARALYKHAALDQPIHPDLYDDVARVLVRVFAMREAQRSRGHA